MSTVIGWFGARRSPACVEMIMGMRIRGLLACALALSAVAGVVPPARAQKTLDVHRVAIADAGVPAGEYARKSLAHLSLLEAYTPRLVGQKDVRAVLHAVEQGELQAGFVYATDARVASVEPLFTFDPASHPPIEYPAAALRGAANPTQARRFVAWLRSETARKVLADAGFLP